MRHTVALGGHIGLRHRGRPALRRRFCACLRPPQSRSAPLRLGTGVAQPVLVVTGAVRHARRGAPDQGHTPRNRPRLRRHGDRPQCQLVRGLRHPAQQPRRSARPSAADRLRRTRPGSGSVHPTAPHQSCRGTCPGRDRGCWPVRGRAASEKRGCPGASLQLSFFAGEAFPGRLASDAEGVSDSCPGHSASSQFLNPRVQFGFGSVDMCGDAGEVVQDLVVCHGVPGVVLCVGGFPSASVTMRSASATHSSQM